MREFFFRYSDGVLIGTSARPNVLWQWLYVFPSALNNLVTRCDGVLQQTATKQYFNTFHYYIPTAFIWMKTVYEVCYTTTVYQILFQNISFYGGMSPLISSIYSWYNGTVCHNCSWSCSQRVLKLLCSAFICYVKAGQIQPTGSPHNFLRTCLRSTCVYTFIEKGGKGQFNSLECCYLPTTSYVKSMVEWRNRPS